MKFKVFIILAFAIVACSKSEGTNSFDVKERDETIVIASKMDIKNDFFLSLYSFVQANKSGLYLTPSNTISDTVLYKYPQNKLGNCCIDLKGIIREGRGPEELLKIYASAKTVSGDTLLFYSPNSAKYIAINNEGTILKRFSFLTSTEVINTGYSFSYSNGRLLLPSYSKHSSSKNLLSLININNNTRKELFEPRVPPGFEPAIRNQIVAMGALPNGFAISFIGDRKIYIIGLNGEVKQQLIFGKSEPIPDPYKTKDPKQAASSKPYITKIEFHKENMLALVDNVIWILDYPSYQTNTLLKILRDPEEESAPVIDFSANDETIYVRMGQDGLYSIKINPNWFK